MPLKSKVYLASNLTEFWDNPDFIIKKKNKEVSDVFLVSPIVLFYLLNPHSIINDKRRL